MITGTFCERTSLRRYPYWIVEEPPVPRINDEYLDCVIYLYRSKDDAERRMKRGGSGFLVGIPSEQHQSLWYTYAITNRHVIVDDFPVICLNTKNGLSDVLELQTSAWLYGNDQDIAVCPIGLSEKHHKFRFIPFQCFLTKDIVVRENIGPGDDVFMVGRFVNHEGKQCNTPSVRFGNLSMMPGELVFHPSNPSHRQESFLADIRTVGGYSGSPVFVCQRAIDTSRRGFAIRPPSDPWLLGVEWGHLNDEKGNNSGMSGVAPAWRLAELLYHPDLIGHRRLQDEKWGKELTEGGVTMT